MKKNNQSSGPDYKKIYMDIIHLKYPEKQQYCIKILSKDKLSATDIIRLNKIIFSLHSETTFSLNQKHRCYDKPAILEILDYQKKHNLNNTQVSKHFKISRNTLAKWKKKFLV
ncbi:helix-turn-helix domain-containing protein [Chryseobacterium sp. PBS4-4]|uniref:Helix-turn-helix domain-containing protein n=1 Tax=Chryseobacterium edaphi TaxID=2976532 RepID=A0ABT2W1J1_9FLAO|nr:helix-turn-helix domain-containing protein [Chryseobacterium edaphi]MCU7615803.1 helix-turn-helix domain-containing protein [Chryseobacterium edaphi]